MAKITKQSSAKKWILLSVNLLVIAGLALFGGYYFKKYRDLKNHPISADQAAQAEIDRTLANVSKLYGSLPADEKPTVYTVTDKEKLKDQPFFDKSQNGDVSLVYPNAKLAILYRPSTNQIINVSSVSVATTPKAQIIGNPDDRKNVAEALDASYKDQLTYEDAGEAKGEYTETYVVDVSGNNSELVKKLATSLKGKVSTLPDAEEKPGDTDIVIIAASSPAP